MIQQLKVGVFVLLMAIGAGAEAQMAVIDPAAIQAQTSSAVTAYQQAVSQYQLLTQQYNQMVQLQQIASGQTSFSSIVNNQLFMGILPADLAGALQGMKTSPTYYAERRKFPPTSNPKLSAYYDEYAASVAMQADFFDRANQRQADIQKIQGKLASGTPMTPAEKQDLLNSLASEQTQMQADAAVARFMADGQKKRVDEAGRAAQQSFICNELGTPTSGC